MSLLHLEKSKKNSQCLLVMAHQTQPLVQFWPTRKTSISLLLHEERGGTHVYVELGANQRAGFCG